MSISSSLNAGVSGLSANATRLGTISDNIANASTFGYRRAETDFHSMVMSSNGGNYTAGGVRTSTQRMISESGSLVSTSNATDIAIRGNGFIPVAMASEVTSGAPNPKMYLSSTGSFRLDEQGYLRSESGLILMGWPADANGDIPIYPRDTAEGLEPVQMTVNALTSQPTTQIDLGINLPSTGSLPPGAEGLATEFVVTLEYYDNMGLPQSLYAIYTPVDDGTGNVTPNTWDMTIYAENPEHAGANPLVGYRLGFSSTNTSGGALDTIMPHPMIDADPVTAGYQASPLGNFESMTRILPQITLPGNTQVIDLYTGTPSIVTPPPLTPGVDATDTITFTDDTGVAKTLNSVYTWNPNSSAWDVVVTDPTITSPKRPVPTLLDGTGTPLAGTITHTVDFVDQSNAARQFDVGYTWSSEGHWDVEVTEAGTNVFSFEVTLDPAGNITNVHNITPANPAAPAPSIHGYDPATQRVTYNDGGLPVDIFAGGAELTAFSFTVAAGGEIDTVQMRNADPANTGAKTSNIVAGTPSRPTVISGNTVVEVFDVIPGQRDGLTQLGNTFAPLRIDRDGAPVGSMTSVEIDENGFVTAFFDNGDSQVIYQVPLAHMANPNGMKAMDRQIFQPTRESGGFVLWSAGSGPTGEIVSFARQESATDVAAELTDMIQTQRAYSSNAKVIQTVDEMLQETMNAKR